MNYKDPALYFKVDIGLPRDMKQLSKLNSSWLKEASKNRRNREMEIQALQRECEKNYFYQWKICIYLK